MQTIIIKWKRQEIALEVYQSTTKITDIKEMLYARTSIRPHRQKLLGLNYQGKPGKSTVKKTSVCLERSISIWDEFSS